MKKDNRKIHKKDNRKIHTPWGHYTVPPPRCGKTLYSERMKEMMNVGQAIQNMYSEYMNQSLQVAITMWENNAGSMNCEDEMPYIENNHIIYVLLHSKGRRACLLLSLDQTIFYHSQSPGFKEDVTFIMADYAAELTKNYQGQMIHERHTYYKLNRDYLITYGVGTIIQREKHEYNQEITILTMYAQEPYESTFKIPLEKMPPLQRRTR